MPSTATPARSSRRPPTRPASPTSSATRSGSPRNPDGTLRPNAKGDAALRKRLRRWYLAHRRDLPWRGTSDPWAIWLSEVMLQQTTVAVGRQRFPELLARFPTVESLATATEDEVLAAWSGLGYYARARNLRSAAQRVAARGALPRSAAELAALPGFGDYTAAAVASIAFGEPVAALDANVARVVARLHAIRGDVRSPPVRARVRRAAGALLDRAHPGDHNQALMDLGASTCTARAPRCRACPLASGCAALRFGDPLRFGTAPRRGAVRRITVAAGVAFRDGRLVLVPDTEVVRGHVTVPLCVVPHGTEPHEALAETWPGDGERPQVGPHLATLRHSVLDRRYTVHVYPVHERGRHERHGVTLAAREEIARLPRGGLLAKVLRLVDFPA